MICMCTLSHLSFGVVPFIAEKNSFLGNEEQVFFINNILLKQLGKIPKQIILSLLEEQVSSNAEQIL